MKNIFFLIIWLLFSAAVANAHDEFDSIQCSGDIPQALIGQKEKNGNAKELEKAHQSIGLKYLWADGLAEDSYNLEAWQICNNEYILLLDRRKNKQRIADVLSLPQEIKAKALSLPTHCERNGKTIAGDFVAILDKTGKASLKPVRKVWEINQSKMKFLSLSTENLVCEAEDF